MTDITINPQQAMKLLNKTKSPILIWARWQAIELCRQKGTTHTREVRDALAFRGVLPEASDERWMGALFNCEFFEDTGATVEVKDETRNIHAGRDSKLWRLKDAYKNIQLPEPQELPQPQKKVRLSRMDQLVRDVQMRIGQMGVQFNFAPLDTLENPLEGDASIVVRYRRRYADRVSGERLVVGTTLEQVLNKVLEQEDLNDKLGNMS